MSIDDREEYDAPFPQEVIDHINAGGKLAYSDDIVLVTPAAVVWDDVEA